MLYLIGILSLFLFAQYFLLKTIYLGSNTVYDWMTKEVDKNFIDYLFILVICLIILIGIYGSILSCYYLAMDFVR